MPATKTNRAAEKKVEKALEAATAKAKELEHQTQKEGYKAVMKDAAHPLGERISAAGHVVSEKLQEMAAKGEYQSKKDALLNATAAEIEAAACAVEGAEEEEKHRAIAKELCEVADDKKAKIGKRAEAVCAGAAERLQELAGEAQYEANKDALRSAHFAKIEVDAATGKAMELAHGEHKTILKKQATDASVPLCERVTAAVEAEVEEELEKEGKEQFESNRKRMKRDRDLEDAEKKLLF
jgi:hypothetical protein